MVLKMIVFLFTFVCRVNCDFVNKKLCTFVKNKIYKNE